jgi:hypothetical protein
MERETTKARTIICYSRHLLRVSPGRNLRYGVKNDSAAYSSTTGTPHEYFLQTVSSCADQSKKAAKTFDIATDFNTHESVGHLLITL